MTEPGIITVDVRVPGSPPLRLEFAGDDVEAMANAIERVRHTLYTAVRTALARNRTRAG